MSFGQDDIDRYTIIYKKDHAPTEDEVFARRSGEMWNAEKAKEYAQKVRSLLSKSLIVRIVFMASPDFQFAAY